MKFCSRTAASIAISGLANSSKIFKGYSLYEGAHHTWDEFASTSRLPSDIAVSLGSKPYPKPPTSSVPSVLAPPTTPQHVHMYNNRNTSPLLSETPLTPCSRHGVGTLLTPSSSHTPASTGNHLNTNQPTASPSTQRTPLSTQSQNAIALAIAHEESSQLIKRTSGLCSLA